MAEETEIGHAVTWLDAQRRQDRDLLEKTQQQIDHLARVVREVQAEMEHLEDELRQTAAQRVRLGALEEALRQARQQLAEVVERGEQMERTLENLAINQQAELERERKTVADVALQVAELFRRADAQRGQLTSAMDDGKRQLGAITSLAQKAEYLEKLVDSFSQKLLVIEDFRKRLEPDLQALHRGQESIQDDFARLLQWQQSTDLRWNRGLSEWQGQMETWARLMEDEGKLVQGVAREIALAKEALEQLDKRVAEDNQRADSLIVDMRRLENAQELDRQETARLLAGQDAMRRRMDDQSGQLRELSDRETHLGGDVREGEGRLEETRKRLEEMVARLGQVEQRQRERGEEQAALQGHLASLRYDLDGLSQHLEEALGEQRTWVHELLGQRQRLEERQKRRQVAELEQEIRELREQLGRFEPQGEQQSPGVA